jgi:hypothetical protein
MGIKKMLGRAGRAMGIIQLPYRQTGHFYSPLINNRDLLLDKERVWPSEPSAPGIDFNEKSHRILLESVFPALLKEFDYPQSQADSVDGYFWDNGQFGLRDAQVLFAMLRHFKPSRMIEIGSGFSSLLTADVNCRYLAKGLSFTCVEPYPRPFLTAGVSGITQLVPSRVEHTPLDLFDDLESGDILFVDSSHVAKTGSDVNHIYFQILPRLKPGVIIHIHDIFLPQDYPQEWVLSEGRCWNEQYVVHALLMLTDSFEFLFGCRNAALRFPDLVRRAMGDPSVEGASIWIRKVN